VLFQDPNVVVKGIERLQTICRDLVQKTGKILGALAVRMRNREKNSKLKRYFRHPLHFLIPLAFPAGYDLLPLQGILIALSTQRGWRPKMAEGAEEAAKDLNLN
jgi:hypothetical protein